MAVTALSLGRVLLIIITLLIIIIITSTVTVTSIITSIIIIISTIIITTIISIIIITIIFILITIIKLNFFLYINTTTVISRKVTRFTIANIGAGLYTVFENIRFDNIGYLDIGFYYSIKIYSITILINGRFGNNNINTANNRGRGGGNRVTGIRIIFSELIIICENFSEITNNFELFNKNVIFKLGALNIKGITDI